MSALTVGSAEGWTVVPEGDRYRWSAFVQGASMTGYVGHRTEAEGKARAALLRLKSVPRP